MHGEINNRSLTIVIVSIISIVYIKLFLVITLSGGQLIRGATVDYFLIVNVAVVVTLAKRRDPCIDISCTAISPLSGKQ